MSAVRGFEVAEQIDNAHPLHTNYPLLPGDLLVRVKGRTRTFAKEAPGIAVIGFVLTREQVSSLRPVRFVCHGLNYSIDRATS